MVGNPGRDNSDTGAASPGLPLTASEPEPGEITPLYDHHWLLFFSALY